jgi:hypothetical protein
VLHIGSYPATASERGAPTSFRVTQLPDAASCVLRCDGAPYPRWRVLDPHTIEIDLDIGEHRIQVFRAATASAAAADWRPEPASASRPAGPTGPAGSAVAPGGPEPMPAVGVPRPPCPCC